jgi:hypothetical protein
MVTDKEMIMADYEEGLARFDRADDLIEQIYGVMCATNESEKANVLFGFKLKSVLCNLARENPEVIKILEQNLSWLDRDACRHWERQSGY